MPSAAIKHNFLSFPIDWGGVKGIILELAGNAVMVLIETAGNAMMVTLEPAGNAARVTVEPTQTVTLDENC